MSCPTYWEQLISLLEPVMVADSYVNLDPDDHIDDGVPDHAYEYPDLILEE